MLFIAQDPVEAARAIHDPLLKDHPWSLPYQPGSWGPIAADALIAKGGGWHNPSLKEKQLEDVMQRPRTEKKDVMGND